MAIVAPMAALLSLVLVVHAGLVRISNKEPTESSKVLECTIDHTVAIEGFRGPVC